MQNTYAMCKEIEALQRRILGDHPARRVWWTIGAIFALQWVLSRRGSISPSSALDLGDGASLMPTPVPFTTNPEAT